MNQAKNSRLRRQTALSAILRSIQLNGNEYALLAFANHIEFVRTLEKYPEPPTTQLLKQFEVAYMHIPCERRYLGGVPSEHMDRLKEHRDRFNLLVQYRAKATDVRHTPRSGVFPHTGRGPVEGGVGRRYAGR